MTVLQPDLDDAACLEHPLGPDAWFARTNSTLAQEALAVCATCPAAAACRQAAREVIEVVGVRGSYRLYGIWAGQAYDDSTPTRGAA